MLAEADPTSGGTGNEYIASYEFAGDVAALGPGVDTFGMGERVMGTTPHSFAQFALSDHLHALLVPEGIDYAEASALPTGLLTEHGALQRAHFSSGQSVLTTGATAGIGLIGVQMAKALGASLVIGTTRTANKRERLARRRRRGRRNRGRGPDPGGAGCDRR